MDVVLRVALLTIIAPAAIGAAGAIVARFLSPGSIGRALAMAISVAAGLVTAHLGAAGAPPIPPVDTLGWLPFVTVAALIVLLPLERRAPRLGALAFLLTAGLAAGAAFLVGRPAWTGGGATALGLGVLAVGGAGAASALDAAARRLPVWSVLACVAAATGGLSVASLFSHTALFAMLLGGAAAALGGLALAGLLLRSLVPARAAFAALALTAVSELLYLRLFAGLPLASAVLGGLSLLAPLAAAILPVRVRGRSFLAIAFTALVAAAAALAAYVPAAAADDQQVRRKQASSATSRKDRAMSRATGSTRRVGSSCGGTASSLQADRCSPVHPDHRESPQRKGPDRQRST